ncbi:MAG: phosphatase PAP2 family protein [Candidatus Aegiribacteria sp.]|nr:phosphatase PAP2 family protein [Candidatus Aegiribacteria sp.]
MFSFKTIYSSVEDRNYRLILIFFTAYTAIMLIVPLSRLVPRVPVPLMSFLLCYFLYRWKHLPGVLRPWLFYPLLALSYWQLQFVVSSHFQEFHGAGIIAFERSLFGQLPVVWLQEQLYHGGIAWYDYIFAVFHSSLYFIPIVFPLLLLVRKGVERMKRATVAMTLITLAGYATYVLFPLTPPWMASLENMIPQVERITLRALGELAPGGIISSFSPSPRGAMPSLHAGVPILVLMIAFREFRWKAWWFTIVVAGICFEIAYGAEHYIIDIIAGLAYAVACYLVVYKWLIPDGRLAPGRPADSKEPSS